MKILPVPKGSRQADAEIGERFYESAKADGKRAAELLFRSQWGYGSPEWYDHRLHWLDPEHHFTDFWTMSADNVIRVLPLGGTLLDLCSGDGFYAYYWWRLRAEVTCIEANKEAYDFAVKHHSHPSIDYINGNILEYRTRSDFFDVVVIRGAIEHFTAAAQNTIFQKSHRALKLGGYFCGDTPAANPEQDKLLDSHECEFASEEELRETLEPHFSEVETFALESATVLHKDTPNGTPGTRTTLFWRCRK